MPFNDKKTILAISSAFLSFSGIAAADPPGGGEYGYHGMMYGAGGWFMMPIMMLIFFGLLVFAVVLIARFLGFSGAGFGRSDNAETILRERFAKGEIEREEFEARMKALGASGN